MKKRILRDFALHQKLNIFFHSIWFFPAILTILLIILSTLQINGSSMGMYHNMLNRGHSDEALLFGKSQSIRPDEWEVNTQKIIAQSNNDYKAVNDNIGLGENETLISDVPTRDWSVLFKPHNLFFFILPFDNAFSLRWWIMAFFLVISCYLFILLIMPRRRLLATILSLAMFFSPFIQWWYAYGTIGSIYYCLFGAIVFSKLLKSDRQSSSILWSSLLAYIAVCFVLVLYPPFQIPCALVLVFYALSFFLINRNKIERRILIINLVYFLFSIIIALIILGIFVSQNYDIISTIQNTSYPGQRIIESGGLNLEYLFSSNLSPVLQSISRTNSYSVGLNQSEASNFILVMPLLFIPMLFINYANIKNTKRIDYLLLAILILLVIMLAWVFIPNLTLLGKISMLDKVSPRRLLIGIGLINFIFTVKFVEQYSKYKGRFSKYNSLIYSLIIFILYLLINFHVLSQYPQFIDYKLAVILATPFPVIVYLMMRKHFIAAAACILIYSLLSTFNVNPIYRGTAILTKSPLIENIKIIGKNSEKRWVSEDLITENFASMAGKKSLTGVYTYPQLSIWENDFDINLKNVYNRYAHVTFSFDRLPGNNAMRSLSLLNPDLFKVLIEPCDKFLQKNNVGYIITQNKFNDGEALCASIVKTVTYPSVTFYIYKLDF